MKATAAITEEEAFWAAIGANPEDQLPRLVFADWMDDNARTLECGECNNGLIFYHRPGIPFPGICECKRCSETGYVPDGRHEQADALRATAGRVPWVKAFKLGYGWWLETAYPNHLDRPTFAVSRPLMVEMSDSPLRCDTDSTVRFDRKCGISGGCILFPTAELAVRDLVRAHVVVTRSGGKG